MFQIMFVGFSFLPLSPLMRINRDEREGDIDFDFPSRDGETRDVSRTKMNMWMGQACASGAIQTNHGRLSG